MHQYPRLAKYMYSFVVECPCTQKKENKKEHRTLHIPVSKKGKLFLERGIEGSLLTTLLSYVRRSFPKTNGISGFQNVKEEVENHVSAFVEDPTKKQGKFEYFIACLKRPDMTMIEAAYYYLRCAFAHGDFSYSKGYWELTSRKGERILMKARLSRATLNLFMSCVSLDAYQIKKLQKNRSSKGLDRH